MFGLKSADASHPLALVVEQISNVIVGKESAVRKCEDHFAAGDAVGMCRFNTALFNSPSLPDPGDFAAQLSELTGVEFTPETVDEAGRNITGLERMLNFRLGLRARDDTLPRRWFEEPNTYGPFQGAQIDRAEFEALKQRFYALTGLNSEGLPKRDWHRRLSQLVTGFAVEVDLPAETPGVPEHASRSTTSSRCARPSRGACPRRPDSLPTRR